MDNENEAAASGKTLNGLIFQLNAVSHIKDRIALTVTFDKSELLKDFVSSLNYQELFKDFVFTKTKLVQKQLNSAESISHWV